MNSKQRRQQRAFMYEVTLVASDTERMGSFNLRRARAKQWLQWNTKRKNYTCGPELYDRQTFKFRSGAMASVFSLKFV